MFTIGPKVKKGAGASIPEASANDPIYKRGFAVGEINLSNFPLHTEEQASMNSNEQSPQEKFIQQLEKKGVKVNVMSRDDLKRKRSHDPKPGEWPKE